MNKTEKDYSAYVEFLSNWFSGLLFLCGFTLTAMTLLITQILEPISIFEQRARKQVPHGSVLYSMVSLINIMSFAGVALLFLYRNLTHPAIISVIISAILIVFSQLYRKPFEEHMKRVPE